MYSASTVLGLVVLLAAIDTGLCISCYQCTSTNDPKCSVGKEVFNSIDCHRQANDVKTFYNSYLSFLNMFLQVPQTSNAPRYCIKLVVGGPLSDAVLRTCVEGPTDNFNKTCIDLERSTNNNFGQIPTGIGIARNTLKHCSVCRTDHCNGAVGTSASITLAVGASLLAYLAYH